MRGCEGFGFRVLACGKVDGAWGSDISLTTVVVNPGYVRRPHDLSKKSVAFEGLVFRVCGFWV